MPTVNDDTIHRSNECTHVPQLPTSIGFIATVQRMPYLQAFQT